VILIPLMMKPNSHRVGTGLLLTGLIAFALFNSPSAKAGSFQINEQSASGMGTAFAGGAAAAEDASTLFYNPAGIALLDHGELQIGGSYIDFSAKFRNQGSRYNLPGTPINGLPIRGGDGGEAGVAHFIGNVYLVQPVFRSAQYGDLSVGVGLTTPYGLETDYSPGWVGRYFSLRTKLLTFDIQPTIAYRLWDRLSLGASLDIQYASARLSQAIDFGLIGANILNQSFFPLVPAPLRAAIQRAYAGSGFVPQGRDGIFEVHGNDWQVGFTVGAIFEYLKPNNEGFFQDGRVGFSYRYGISHDVKGSAEFRGVPAISGAGLPAALQFPLPNALQNTFFGQSASATGLNLPDVFHFSIYQRFAHQFAIMGDVAWTRWSSLKTININFDSGITPSSSLIIDYKDTIRAAIGLEWYATKNFTFRLGFAYDESPIRSDATRTPRIPDNDRYFVAVGARWSPTSWVDFDLAYAHLFVDDPTTNLVDSQGHNLRGTYDANVNIVSVSATLRWGGPKEQPAPLLPGKSGKSMVSYSK
jgi:long-chain fatty acid transport protein